ncbi:MAG: tetratricopeptide repeat protein [Desulfatiglandales bacterium]
MKTISYLTACAVILALSILFLSNTPAMAQTARDYFDTATRQAQEGAFDLAEETFKKAIQLEPAMAGPAYFQLAMACMQHRKPARAVAYYEKALEYNPGEAVIYVNLANAYMSTGDFDKTVETYNKIISMNPKEAWPHFNLANLYLQRGLFSDAAESFERAVEIDPSKFPGIYEKLGYAHQMTKNYNRAIKAYEKEVEKNPKAYMSYYNMGLCYYSLHDLDNALTAYKKALELQPKNPEAMTNLGFVYFYKNELILAENAFQDALVQNPAQGEALFGMAMVYRQKGRYREALDYTEKAVAAGRKVSQDFIDSLKLAIEGQS